MNMTAEEKEHKVKLKVTEVIAELCETETNILQSETQLAHENSYKKLS